MNPLVIGLCTLSIATFSFAQQIPTSDAPQEKASISFHLENDVFIGNDDCYTNGVRFGWQSASTIDDESFAGILGTMLGGTNASNSWKQIMGMTGSDHLRQQWGINLTQKMFTPEHRYSSPLYGSQPYVGHLALGLSSLVKNEDRANSFEFQLGTTGSASLGKGAQHFVHKLFDMEQWPGWGTQMPSELTLNAYFKRFYRLRSLETHYTSGLESDALAYWHIDAGTVKCQAGAGFTWRIGYELGNSVPDNFIMGANTATPFVYNRKAADWSYYGYLHGAIRAVAHDLYLDGTVFHSYPEYVNKYPVVAEGGIGFGIRYKDFDFLFGLHYSTRQYTSQESNQCHGVLQMRYSF